MNLISIIKRLFPQDKANSPIQCPGCGHKLDKTPERKTKCNSCGRYIYVRTDYKTKERLYLSEQGKDAYDKEESDYSFQKEWKNKLLDRGVKEEELLKIEKDLKDRWQIPSISFNDLAWAAFSHRFIGLGNERASYHEYSRLYFSWALFAWEINSDPTELMRIAHRYELLELKQLGFVKRVKVIGSNGCKECKEIEGKIFSLNDLLPKQEVLPHRLCTQGKEFGHKYAWCRCSFVEV